MSSSLVLVLACVLTSAWPTCDLENSRPLPGSQLLDDGDLKGPDGLLHPAGTHWLDEQAGVERVCDCSSRPCVRKCCLPGMMLLEKCEPDDSDAGELQVTVFNLEEDRPEVGQFTLLYHDPCPYGKYALSPTDNPATDLYQLLPNGTLRLISMFQDMTPDEYCLENFPGVGVLPVVCFTEEEETPEEKGASYTLYPVGMIMSQFFLVSTLLTYALIPELRNLHGLCLMSYVCALTVAYFFLAVLQLGDIYRGSLCCVVLGGAVIDLVLLSVAADFILGFTIKTVDL